MVAWCLAGLLACSARFELSKEAGTASRHNQVNADLLRLAIDVNGADQIAPKGQPVDLK